MALETVLQTLTSKPSSCISIYCSSYVSFFFLLKAGKSFAFYINRAGELCLFDVSNMLEISSVLLLPSLPQGL